MTKRNHFRAAGAFAAIAASALTVAACTPPGAGPSQTQANNPTVTYAYQSDQDLIQANRAATTHCARYSAAAQTLRFSSEPNGSRSVIFECVPAVPVAAPAVAQVLPPAAPGLSFTYTLDQELLQGSRTAQMQCANAGLQYALIGIAANGNGTKTATFQCVPR